MTPHCCNCLHWDEESAEDNQEGLGLCSLWTDLKRLENKKGVLVIRTTGDDTCHHFCPRRVVNGPTQVTSETE